MIRNILDIMLHYLRLTYSERSTLIFQIAMPLLFTFLIGQATGGFGSNTSSASVSWTLAVANEDVGVLGALLVESVAADPAVDVAPVAANTAVTQIENGAATAVLIIPANFSETVLAGQGVALDFYSDPGNIRNVQPVAEAVKAALAQVEGYVKSAAVSTAVADELGLFAQGVDPHSFRMEALAEAQITWNRPPIVVQVNEDEMIVANENLIANGTNQSSPGMMAMFVTFSMTGGAAVLIQERRWGTLRRLAVMPVRKSSIIGGKLLGILTAGIAQMFLLILAGMLLFGVAWGNAPAALAIMVISFALAISSLGLMMAALVKTTAQANALSTILVLSMSALGGAWWPLEIVPGWMQMVGQLSPIYWAMHGFQDMITRNLGVTAVLPEAMVLLAFAALFLAIGIWRFKYE